MALRRWTKWILLAPGWPLSVLLVIWIYASWPGALNPDDLSEWILIKHYRGRLSNQPHEFTASVYAYYRVSKSAFDPYGAQQNRIEVRELDGTPVSTFLWPGDDYTAGWCEIRDLNKDGRKELLLYAGANSLRVVAFDEHGLGYKPAQDDLGSVRSEIETLDLDEDERAEFVVEEWFPQRRFALEWIAVPRVKHWDPQNGFTDASKNFPDYYRRVVIPELERKGRKYRENERLYLEAVQHLETEILNVKR